MMKNYNVTGEDRKRMVRIISETTGQDAVYTRMPECAYVIGDLKVSKVGELIWDESTATDVIATVTSALEAAGFTAEENTEEEEGVDAADNGEGENEESTDAAEPEEPDSLSFSFPRADFTDTAIANLKALIASKAALIAKSLQAERLDIEISDDKITFPWWDHMPTPTEITAYGAFLAALVKMAKEAKRVTAKEHPTESEKYTFRVFLLRLGFIGPEHKETRAILMKPLSGYAAFKNKVDADAFYARLKEQKATAYTAEAAGTEDNGTDETVTDAEEETDDEISE